MSLSEIYRAHAAAERASAEGSALLNRRAIHEQSAIVWDRMALSAEKSAARTRINLAAKVRKADGEGLDRAILQK